MVVRGGDLTGLIEEYAPVSLAEPWDRVGWQLGDPSLPVDKVIVTLDPGPEALAAAAGGNGLVVSHHPLFLQPLPHIRTDEAPGGLVASFLRQGTGLYVAHTNLDRAREGVSAVLAQSLGVTDCVALGAPEGGTHRKICVFVPVSHLEQVREAVFAAGAGQVGNYGDCSFAVRGTGTFRPGPATDPFIGEEGRLSRVEEARLETIVPAGRLGEVIGAMLRAHPYEEVAYDIYALENRFATGGLGWLGDLPDAVSLGELASRVKSALGASQVRMGGPPAEKVRRVAVAGGSGASLWREAYRGEAQVLVTGEIKYHEARDMLAAGLCFVEAGHATTERIILPRLIAFLTARCREQGWPVEVQLAGNQDEPYRYV